MSVTNEASLGADSCYSEIDGVCAQA